MAVLIASSMAISDTVSGVGCIDRKTVRIGTDLLFLSDDGLRSLGDNTRKVFAYIDLSRNVKQELIGFLWLKPALPAPYIAPKLLLSAMPTRQQPCLLFLS